MRRVLKLEPGERIIFISGNGFEYSAELSEITKNEILFKITDITNPETETSHSITLYAAIIKRNNFEWICEKATEIGVTKIVPIITERTIKTGISKDRLESIIKEATEQSGRTKIPELGEIMNFKDAIESLSNPKYACIFNKDEEDLDNSYWKDRQDRSLFIGPEGGFTEKEIAHAKEKGLKLFSLGPRTFRAETAAIIGCFLLSN